MKRKMFQKVLAMLLAAALMPVLLSGCGSSSSTGKNSSVGGGPGAEGGTQSAGKDGVTWSWGTFRGLYGYAEVTFNEDGGRDTVLLKYPNGALYREIRYNYEFYVGNMDETTGGIILGDKAVYPSEKYTLDAVGNTLYEYYYSWFACEMVPSSWGAGMASDVTPILAAGEAFAAGETPEVPEERYYSQSEHGYDVEKKESTGSTQYQELSHTMVKDKDYQSTYEYGGGYWLTKHVGGDPAKTWFYAADGRLDEKLTITWNYDHGKPVSLQKCPYKADTYKAEISDDGLTVTYVLDNSHTGQDGDGGREKYLTQVYTLTLSCLDDGKPAMYKYSFYKEFINTNDPADMEYSIIYEYDNGVLSGAVYQTPKRTYTITCNDKGMLEAEDNTLRDGMD